MAEIDKAALEMAADILRSARNYPPEGHPRRADDGYPMEFVYDEFAYKRIVDTYRDAMSNALDLLVTPAAPPRIGSRGRTAEGVETVVVPVEPEEVMIAAAIGPDDSAIFGDRKTAAMSMRARYRTMVSALSEPPRAMTSPEAGGGAMSEDISEDAAEFRCLVPFPDQSDSFVHGFEAGMVWRRMIEGEPLIENEIAYHVANVVVFERMAAAQGYDIEFEDCGDGCWTLATFTKRPKRFGVIEGGRHDI